MTIVSTALISMLCPYTIDIGEAPGDIGEAHIGEIPTPLSMHIPLANYIVLLDV